MHPVLKQGRQLDFKAHVVTSRGTISAHVMTDSGASAMSFIDSRFVRQYKLEVLALEKRCHLVLADGGSAPDITHIARMHFKLGDHTEDLWGLVTQLGKYNAILGMPWLEQHNPRIDWTDRTMTLRSNHCLSNCLPRRRPVHIASCSRPSKELRKTKFQEYDIAEISAYAFMGLAKREQNQVVSMWPEDFEALDATDLARAKGDPASARMTADVAAITVDDYDKFFRKLRKKHMSLDDLRKRIPHQYHDYVDVWNPVEANKLPPHRKVDHSIDLKKDAIPPAKRAYGMSRDQAKVVKEYINDMLGKGYIRPSNSPYAAPVLIVKKPDGGLRVCVDYRALNALTIRNRNAPPLIRETLAKLCTAKWYSKFDIIAAFNEIRMKEGHEQKTAFLTRYGLFEYLVMPFGLCNAPGTFQAFINETLRDFLDVFCTAYLDDILVYSSTERDHVHHVRQVLEKLREVGLFLDINKCDFHVTSVKYLGIIITTDGLQMDPSKVEAIQQWKAPRCLKDVQSFLGFANFYRRFIKGYSKIASPLSRLTKSDQKAFTYPWPDDGPENQAFEQLKKAFTNAPALAHFNPDLETWVETDASDYVVAAILSQRDLQGVLRPVAYLSKKMSPQECNYEIYDKELLAIVRAFEEWHPELAGTPVEDPIKILSDHRNLEYFMTTKQLNRRQARWAEFLSEFNFLITYRPGKQGTKPDSLTRRSQDLPLGIGDARNKFQHQVLLKQVHLDKGVNNAAELAVLLLDEKQHTVAELAAMIYDMSEQEISDGELNEEPSEDLRRPSGGESNEDPPDANLVPNAEESNEESADGTLMSDEDLLQQIRNGYEVDELAQAVIAAKESGHRKLPPVYGGAKVELADCEIVNGQLYVTKRLYIPDIPELRTKIIEKFHTSKPAGHAGRAVTYHRLSSHYYWPGMTDTVQRYIRNCHTCKRTKAYREAKAGLLKPLPIPERYWQDITVDFITPLPKCRRHGRIYEHIMVVVDRLSKKRKFVGLDSLEVETAVQAFLDWVWREEGYPKTIVSDRGTQFVSHFWRRLCERIGTKPKLSTAFHPETDGQTEAANMALKQYLRAYVNYQQDDWMDLLPIAEFEANSSLNASTGVAPFLATKGYIPRSGLEPPAPWSDQTPPTAIREMRAADEFVKRINDLQTHLREELVWTQATQKHYADRHRAPARELRVGDKVMLNAKNIKTKRNSKGLDHKNLGPFPIKRVINNTAYELDLGRAMASVFPVFHPWLLHLVADDPLPGQRMPPPPPVEIDEEGETYYVDKVLDSKIDRRMNDPMTGERGCLMYKLKYRGFEEEPEWQVYTEVAGAPLLVADFHHENPRKPGPHSTFETPQEWEALLACLAHDSYG